MSIVIKAKNWWRNNSEVKKLELKVATQLEEIHEMQIKISNLESACRTLEAELDIVESKNAATAS